MEQWFGNRDANAWEKIVAEINTPKKALEFISRRRTGWYNVQIAKSMLGGRPTYFPAINKINNGAISNLSDDIFVEVPGVICRDSVKAIHVGPLPDQIAPYCSLIGSHNNLIADAAATGSKEKALQALMLDPLVHSLGKAEKILDDILEYNKKYQTCFS